MNQADYCPLVGFNENEKSKDPRYTKFDVHNDKSFDLGEWSVQKENDVAEILLDLPSYTKDISMTYAEPFRPEYKNRVPLDFYTRSTIPWKLECESEGYDRQYILEISNIELLFDE